MSDLVSRISTWWDSSVHPALNSWYDNSQDLTKLCYSPILDPNLSVFAPSERWGSYFNTVTFCVIVEQWCGLQWFTMAIGRIYWDVWAEYCGSDSLFCIISKYESKIKMPSLQSGYPLVYCHNITVLLILFGSQFWVFLEASQSFSDVMIK